MKKGIFIKVKLLTHHEYKRLSRILKIRLGVTLDSARKILYALEEGCNKLDSAFSYTTDCDYLPATILGSYDPERHIIYIAPETYNNAYNGNLLALYTIVHEISHWALITLFHVKPDFILLELPVAFSVTTDAEFYADMLSVHLMMPDTVFSRTKKIKTLLTKGKKRGIYNMSLTIFKYRRYYRAIGFKHPHGFHMAKKTA